MNEPVDRETRSDDGAVAGYLAHLAASAPVRRASLPDTDLLWVKARLLQRWEAERQMQAPLDVLEPMQVATGLAAAAALLVWSLPSLMRALAHLGG